MVKSLSYVAATKERQDQDRTRLHKQAFLEAFPKNLGLVKKTCDAIGVQDSTFYRWKDADPEFAAAIKAARVHFDQQVEDVLFEKMFAEKDGPSLRFFMERRMPAYKAKQITEIVSGTRTLEDILDEAEARAELTEKAKANGDHPTTEAAPGTEGADRKPA